MFAFLKQTWLIIALGLLAIAAGWYYLSTRPPAGVTPQSGADDIVSTITALTAAVVSLGGAVAGIAMKFLDYRKEELAIKVQEHELAVKKHELEAMKREADDG